MWIWIIKVTVISILLIFLLDYLYSFFKQTLTSPKLKDLVDKPQAKYNTIYNSIKNVGDVNLGEYHPTKSNNINNYDISKTSSMKDELKKYLKELNIGSSSSNGDNGNSVSNGGNDSIVSNGDNSGVRNSLTFPFECNDNVSVYSPSNIMTNVGANGISTRVNTAPNYMSNINKTNKQSNIDYATPNVSSSYSSPYSPY